MKLLLEPVATIEDEILTIAFSGQVDHPGLPDGTHRFDYRFVMYVDSVTPNVLVETISKMYFLITRQHSGLAWLISKDTLGAMVLDEITRCVAANNLNDRLLFIPTHSKLFTVSGS